jgi:ubiquinone/menaquinone biosynthesis C-methylase UbiE
MGNIFKNNINVSVEAYKKTNYKKSYERHVFLYTKIKKILKNKKILNILDIGCGNSGFIHYLKKRHPNHNYYGIEINQDLINEAKKEPFLNGIILIKGDARYFKIDRKFDVVIMAGVLSIFDNFKEVLSNMLYHIKPNGRGFVFGAFNSEDIDVIVRCRNNYLQSRIWESGLNMFSLNTIKKYLLHYIKGFKISRFELKIKLKKQKNPGRTFTIEKKNGKNIIVNGANIIRDFYVVEFVKK